MSRRMMVFVLSVAILACTHPAQAQQAKKVPRIGYLTARTAPSPANPDPNAEAFRQGLRDLGYIEGKNILIEYRYAEGKQDKLPSLAAELMQLKVDLIVSVGGTAIRSAKQVTKTIPIVMVVNVDPVATGLVDSLARPGGKYHGARQTHCGIKRETAGIA